MNTHSSSSSISSGDYLTIRTADFIDNSSRVGSPQNSTPVKTQSVIINPYEKMSKQVYDNKTNVNTPSPRQKLIPPPLNSPNTSTDINVNEPVKASSNTSTDINVNELVNTLSNTSTDINVNGSVKASLNICTDINVNESVKASSNWNNQSASSSPFKRLNKSLSPVHRQTKHKKESCSSEEYQIGALDHEWKIGYRQFLACMLSESALVEYFDRPFDLAAAIKKYQENGGYKISPLSP